MTTRASDLVESGEAGIDWKPVLTGDERDRATEVVHSVARSLLAHPATAPQSSGEARYRPRDVCLSRGLCGAALFFGYLDRAIPDEGHRGVALDLLDEAIDAASRQPTRPRPR